LNNWGEKSEDRWERGANGNPGDDWAFGGGQGDKVFWLGDEQTGAVWGGSLKQGCQKFLAITSELFVLEKRKKGEKRGRVRGNR